MRDKRTPKDVCGEAREQEDVAKILYVEVFLQFNESNNLLDIDDGKATTL